MNAVAAASTPRMARAACSAEETDSASAPESSSTPDFITVLECQPGKRAAKRFRRPPNRRNPNAALEEDGYDAGESFKAVEVPLTCLADLHDVLNSERKDPKRFVIAAKIKADVPRGDDGWTDGHYPKRKHDRGREGERNYEPALYEPALHHWLCLDFDKTEARTLDELRTSLPDWIREAGYIWAPSASAGQQETLRGHLFVWLDRAIGETEARALCEGLGADKTVMQAVQPIFIADPIFEGCTDPLAGEREPVLCGGDVARVPDAIAVATASPPRAAPVGRAGTAGVAAGDADVQALVALVADAYAEGGRHAKGRALAGWLVKSRSWADESIEAAFSQLPTGQTEKRVRDALATARQAREDAVPTAGWGELKAQWGNELADQLESTVPDLQFETPWWKKFLPRWAARGAANAEGDATDEPMILQSRTDADLVLLKHPEHGYTPVAPRALRLRIKELSLPIEIEVENEKGAVKQLPVATIIESAGRTFGRAIYDFSQARSRYESDRDQVLIGYPLAAEAGAFDQDVDKWLRALAGDKYDRVEAWIASCGQQHMNRLAAALVLIGPANVGKSLFACACAGVWNEHTPPNAGLLVAQFNGDLRRCPIVFDDEAKLVGSQKWSTKDFREAIQGRERSIEPKGRERVQLRSAMRLIIAGNALSDLKFTDVTGADVVNAVGDRLAIIDVKPRAEAASEALNALRLPGDYSVDMPRVVGHLRWIVANVEIPTERFVGATGGVEAVLAGHVTRYPDVYGDLVAWVDAGGKQRDRWLAHGKKLCVDPAKPFGDAMKPLPRSDVEKALEPFTVQKGYRPRTGGRARLWVLDHERIAGAVGIDPAVLKGIIA